MMNEKTRQNAMEAERTTPQKVWCVISIDKYCDASHPYVSVFANREKAMRCLEGAVEEDCDTYGEEPRWNDLRTECHVGHACVHRLDEQWVNA